MVFTSLCAVRINKLIDTKISTPLFHLALFAIARGDPPTSLAERNLLRHITWSLPSGQTPVQQMGAPVVAPDQMSETSIGDIFPPFLESTPLWFYVLHEALVQAEGRRSARWAAATLPR